MTLFDRVFGGNDSGIENTTLRSKETFPENRTAAPGTQAAVQAGNFRNGRSRPATSGGVPAYSRTTTLTQFPGFDLRMGLQDPVVQEVVR